MRRLLALSCAIVLVDTVFYAALTPLVPYFNEEFGLSKAAVGVLSGAYGAGVLVGSAPGAYLASRAGVKAAAIAGLILMSLTSLAFGLAVRRRGLQVEVAHVSGDQREISQELAAGDGRHQPKLLEEEDCERRQEQDGVGGGGRNGLFCRPVPLDAVNLLVGEAHGRPPQRLLEPDLPLRGGVAQPCDQRRQAHDHPRGAASPRRLDQPTSG